MNDKKLLQVSSLSIDFKAQDGGVFNAVKNINFDLDKGETLALVGESGSGKSLSALSIMRLLPPASRLGGDTSIYYNGRELTGTNENDMRAIRGSQIGMIFQEPLTALNPLHTIEKQIGEVLDIHQGLDNAARLKRILELLDMVGLDKIKDRIGAYPHELSGGQRQRVMIAMALANNPDLLIADEPTTALDVTVEDQILRLLKDLQQELGMALLMITHDLGVVESFADNVCVMQKGQIVERATANTLFAAPQHDYTKMLLSAQPKDQPPKSNHDATEILRAENIEVHFTKEKDIFGRAKSLVHAVDGIDITLREGQTLGVVGESGSGKSTLGAALIKLLPAKGQIVFCGNDISGLNRKAMRNYRSKMQIVFQDPFGSLSPRMSVGDIIEEGLKIHFTELTKAQREQRVIETLETVSLPPEFRHRYPHEFSGGQRQRISIARALILKPDFIVLDEPTSALDVSVQAGIVDLLRELQDNFGLSYLFISHDLRVVRAMSHDIAVMKDGKIVEYGPANDVFNNPRQDYTKTLLNAALHRKTAKS